METIDVKVIKPGTKVKLVDTPEIKTEIRDARVDVFIDRGDSEKILTVVEYGLQHRMNAVYPATAFTAIEDAPETKKDKVKNP